MFSFPVYFFFHFNFIAPATVPVHGLCDAVCHQLMCKACCGDGLGTMCVSEKIYSEFVSETAARTD